MRNNFNSGLWSDFFQWNFSSYSDKIGNNLLTIERALPFNKTIPIRAAFEQWCSSENAKIFLDRSRSTITLIPNISKELRLRDLKLPEMVNRLRLELALGCLDQDTINKLQKMVTMQCTSGNKKYSLQNIELTELAQNFSRMLHRAGGRSGGALSLLEALEFQADTALTEFKILLGNSSKEEKHRIFEQKNILGMNPLMCAAMYDKSGEWVSFLLDCGVNPNIADKQGINAFFHACTNSNSKAAKILLNHIDYNLTDREGRSVLHYAVYLRDHKIGVLQALHEELIKKKVWSNFLEKKDKEGETPLFVAIGRGNYAAVEFLVDAGADIMSRDIYAIIPLTRAINCKRYDVANYLIEKMKPERIGKFDLYNPSSPFFSAIFMGKYEIAKKIQAKNLLTQKEIDNAISLVVEGELIENENENLMALDWLLVNGADPNTIIQPIGTTLIGEAAARGEKDIVKKLLEKGADPRKKDIHGKTASESAEEENYYELAQLLLSKEEELDIIESLERIDIIEAIKKNDLDGISHALNAGASPNQRDNNNIPALCHAIDQKNYDCILTLLNNGAYPNVEYQDGNDWHSAMEKVIQNGDRKAFDILLESFKKNKLHLDDPFKKALALEWPQDSDGEQNRLYMLEKMCEVDPDLCFREDDSGNEPIFAAVRLHQMKALEFIIKKYPQLIEYKKKVLGDEITPLIFAIGLNRPEAVDILLAAGASPLTPTLSGNDAFGIAANRQNNQIITKLRTNILNKVETLTEEFSLAAQLYTILEATHKSGVQENNLHDIDIILSNQNFNPNRYHKEHSLLYWAAFFEHPQLIKKLFNRGASPDYFNTRHNLTPLSAAIFRKNVTCLIELLNIGVSISALEPRGHSVLKLHEILSPEKFNEDREKSIEIVQNVCMLNVNLEQKDQHGDTLLAQAILSGNADLARIFIDYGANQNSRNNAGQTPIDLAKKSSNPEIVELFKQY